MTKFVEMIYSAYDVRGVWYNINMDKLTRKYVEETYNITLTDARWRVIVEEMQGEPDSDSIAYGLRTYEECLFYVVDTLDQLEQDYAFWDKTTGKTVAEALEDLEETALDNLE
jgi:hypothetical protein